MYENMIFLYYIYKLAGNKIYGIADTGGTMFCKTYCASVIGVDAQVIQVEADVNDGLPVFHLVGFLTSEVREARERVRSAIKNIGWGFPAKRVTVNLSPADIRKDGTAYDLAIAIALLSAFGRIKKKSSDNVMFIGELSLDGHINAVNGVLPMVSSAKNNGFEYCVVPVENVSEGTMVGGIKVIGARSLDCVIDLLERGNFDDYVSDHTKWDSSFRKRNCTKDFSEVAGQELIKRASQISAAGGHNLLMVGPPGSGKTMIAERIPGIMPLLTMQESIEVARIFSIYGELKDTSGYIYERPFRAPHHTIPRSGLIGGGIRPVPGEISLAHRGVLFLDELTEFNRSTIELLRLPLENKKIIHTRSNSSVEYPCDFILVAAMNPCPCGYYPDKKRCRCSSQQIRKYLGKLSYAFLDRIDIVAQVQPVPYEMIEHTSLEIESSETMRNRVESAVIIQTKRYEGTEIRNNAGLHGKYIKKWCKLDKYGEDFLSGIFDEFELSARSYYKVLKVARTIADIDGCENISLNHLKEAVFYRSVDREYWRKGGNEIWE